MVMTKETSLGVNEIFEVLKEKVEIKQKVAEANAYKIQVVRQARPVTTPKPPARDDSSSSSHSSSDSIPNRPRRNPHLPN